MTFLSKNLLKLDHLIAFKIFQSLKNQNEQPFILKSETLEIKYEKYKKLKRFNLTFGITTNAIFQFIWHRIFSIYSNAKQTIIGTTVSGRNIPVKNIENVVGCFINTLPLIVNHQNNDINLIDKIKLIQGEVNELNIHSNVKLSKLQLNSNKLFDVLFVFENFPEVINGNINQLNIKFIDSDNK